MIKLGRIAEAAVVAVIASTSLTACDWNSGGGTCNAVTVTLAGGGKGGGSKGKSSTTKTKPKTGTAPKTKTKTGGGSDVDDYCDDD